MREPVTTYRRLAKFSLVGSIGIVVQLAVLSLLTAIKTNYLIATIGAVESAILQFHLAPILYLAGTARFARPKPFRPHAIQLEQRADIAHGQRPADEAIQGRDAFALAARELDEHRDLCSC